MATPLGAQLVGLALPALKGSGGYFATAPANNVAWSNLIIAIFTPLGSRPFNRSFGCPLSSMLFIQNTGALDATIEAVIKQAVATWTNNVKVVNVMIGHMVDKITITITFMKASDNTVYSSPPVPISLNSIVNLLAQSSAA